jgi:thioredoxin reductase
MDNFKEHAIKAGTEILEEMVESITKHQEHFHVKTTN